MLGFDRARVLPRSGGAGQRPDLVSRLFANPVLGAPSSSSIRTASRCPAAGTIRQPAAQHRSAVRLRARSDLAFFKNFAFGGTRRIQLRAEGFNITNHVNFGLPAATVFNCVGRVTTAGQITTIVGTARQFQFGAKFEF